MKSSLFIPYYFAMTKKKSSLYDPNKLIEAINKWTLPIFDKKHGYYIHVEGRARSNQSRTEHIVQYSHDLKLRDIESVPEGINNYFSYKKDPVYKNTFNYYIKRKGMDRGLIKVSIQIDNRDHQKEWIKTFYITYVLK